MGERLKARRAEDGGGDEQARLEQRIDKMDEMLKKTQARLDELKAGKAKDVTPAEAEASAAKPAAKTTARKTAKS